MNTKNLSSGNHDYVCSADNANETQNIPLVQHRRTQIANKLGELIVSWPVS